jgi:Ca2+/Na+ antiporter
MFLLLKVIPILSIWREKMQFHDIIATFVLFIVYLFWVIVVNKKNFYDFTKQTNNLIIHNKNTLPGMIFLDKLGIF